MEWFGRGGQRSRAVTTANEDRFKALKEIIVPTDLAAVKQPEQAILEEAARCGYCENAVFAIKLALEEAIVNAIRHGNKLDPKKHISVRYEVTPERIVIEVRDEGNGFKPHAIPDPTEPDFIDRPHGRGIMLMRAYLDEVQFCETGNMVRLVKHKEGSEPGRPEDEPYVK